MYIKTHSPSHTHKSHAHTHTHTYTHPNLCGERNRDLTYVVILAQMIPIHLHVKVCVRKEEGSRGREGREGGDREGERERVKEEGRKERGKEE